MSDRDLALEVLRGNGTALGALLSRHEPYLRRAAGALLRGTPNAEMLLGEAYQSFLVRLLENGAHRIAMWQGLTEINEPDASIAPYLGQILRNVTIDLLRRLDNPMADDGDIAGDAPHYDNPEDQLDREQQRRLVRHCVDALPEAMRSAMRLRLEGWSDAEGAARLRIQRGTFRQRIHAGTHALADCVRELA